MNNVKRVILIGVAFGVVGIAGQLLLLYFNSPQALRAALTFLLAVLIGVLAGFTGKDDAIKAAGLAGFLTGAMVTAVGMMLILRNPALIGNPFASAEAAFSFMSSVMAGTVISSWLVAAVSVLVALPISQTLQKEVAES